MLLSPGDPFSQEPLLRPPRKRDTGQGPAKRTIYESMRAQARQSRSLCVSATSFPLGALATKRPVHWNHLKFTATNTVNTTIAVPHPMVPPPPSKFSNLISLLNFGTQTLAYDIAFVFSVPSLASIFCFLILALFSLFWLPSLTSSCPLVMPAPLKRSHTGHQFQPHVAGVAR